jgi:hypothetical protein
VEVELEDLMEFQVEQDQQILVVAVEVVMHLVQFQKHQVEQVDLV